MKLKGNKMEIQLQKFLPKVGDGMVMTILPQ